MTRPPVRGTTAVYAIIGDPVAHSVSPPMQNAAFVAAGIDAIYVALHVRADRLRAAVDGFAAADIRGFNVTVPHKEAVYELVEPRPRADACGAVNTVVRRGERWIGDNTDGDGFLADLADTKFQPRQSSVLVIGAGGSARGIVAALLRAGAKELVVANRTVARADALIADLVQRNPRHAARCSRLCAAPLDVLRDRETLARADLIVNCTSAGLGDGVAPALAFAATRREVIAYDVVYARAATKFMTAARRAGRRARDGRGMLLHQGALAFTMWTRRPAPLAVMRRALAAALRTTLS